MVCDLIKDLIERTIDEFKAVYKFRELTLFAFYIIREKLTKLKESPITFNYSEHTNIGLSTEKISPGSLPNILESYEKHYANELCLQYIVSIFENFVFDLMKDIMIKYPKQLNEQKEIKVGIITNQNSMDELIYLLIDQELSALKYKNLKDWIDRLKKMVSITGPSTDEVKKISEIKATRDLLVHNKGIVDETYIKKAGKLARYKKGERIEVSYDYFLSSWGLLLNVTHKIATEVIQTF